jgi:phosphoglycerate dehydrogenase-like enzyme
MPKEVKPLRECRVLCTPASFGRKDPALKAALEATVGEVVYNPFGRPLKAEELLPLVAKADGYIAGVDEVNASVIRAAPYLKVIAAYGVGIDRIDVEEAISRGIVVTNVPRANSAAVAELTLSMILCLARRLISADAAVKRGEWPLVDGIGIQGKTIGIVGLGAIGREVCRRLAGFGCHLLASDPYVDAAACMVGVRLVSLDELLCASDFVSLHLPASAATRGMVDRGFLEGMRHGAFLINTARGDLIDEAALVEALLCGSLQGAALDCLSKEPPERDNPLLRFPQVIVTPHTGSHTDEALNRMGWTALRNCLAVLKGENPPHAVKGPEPAKVREAR